MRVYDNWNLAYDEIKRNVSELGTTVHLQTMQDKNVKGDSELGTTKELFGESYTLTGVRAADIVKWMYAHEYNVEWLIREFNERVAKNPTNPGTAWKFRKEVWKEFLHGGKFSYTYGLRMKKSLKYVIGELKKRSSTRQAVLSVWDPNIDPQRMGKKRVPCSIFYQFLLRNDSSNRRVLHMVYVMRSSDIFTHFPYDVALALLLQEYVCDQLSSPRKKVYPGNFVHFMTSCHAYATNLKGIF